MATSRTANPCGVTYEQTIKIIKDNVLTGNYNGRKEVMDGLLKAGFSYNEATAVTDTYYKIYKRLSADFKPLPKPKPLQTPAERATRKLNTVAVDYLNGNLKGFDIDAADEDQLIKFYEKAEIANTPELKEKFNEQANQFVQKFMPNYTNELFKSHVYANPLFSAVFFAKSITSNLHAQVEGIIRSSLFSGSGLNFQNLWRFMGAANLSSWHVLAHGGVPATNIQQTEENLGGGKARLEEFSLSGTEAESNATKAKFYSVMKFGTKWSSRGNNAPDTRGIYANAERHMFDLLREKYIGENKTKAEALQEALKHMELSDLVEATKVTAAIFKKLELPIYTTTEAKDVKTEVFDEFAKKPKYTTEFKLAVAEQRRLVRDKGLWAKALELSKNDFWKKNMTMASKLGFGDYGLFGVKAQAFNTLKKWAESKKHEKLSTAFNLFSFGFINGAANFGEDAIERVAPYALVKLAALQYKKRSTDDLELRKDIARRQRDIITKNVTTTVFFLTMQMVEELLCKDYKGKQSTAEISAGRVQTGVCGIPVIIPPQMLVAYKFWKIATENFTNGEGMSNFILNVFPIMMQENQLGMSGLVDKIFDGGAKMAAAQLKGQEAVYLAERDKMVTNIVKAGASYGNSFLPYTTRGVSEVATVVSRLRGRYQPQVDLPIAIDKKGKVAGIGALLGKITVAGIGNVSGISDIMVAAKGAQKTYAVDWLGRKIVQFRGTDVIGSGIQYTAADDIVATAGVATPYLSRISQIEIGKEVKESKDITGVKVKETTVEKRFMTDEEYFNASVGMGKYNEKFFKQNKSKLTSLVKKDRDGANRYLRSHFDKVKKRSVAAIAAGMKTSDGVYGYITRSMQADKVRSVTKTELAESEEE